MLGELNASHMGISAPPQGRADDARTRSPIDFDRAEYDASGRLDDRVGRRARAGGDRRASRPATTSTQVDGQRDRGRASNLDELLDHTIGKRDRAVGRRVVAPAPPRDVDRQADRSDRRRSGLRYREWVEQKRAYVAKASGGRLGYVHMFDMSAGALVAAARRSRRRQSRARRRRRSTSATTTAGSSTSTRSTCSRGAATSTCCRAAARRCRRAPLLGQRALELPTILVTQPALAVGRRGFHRRLSHAEARQGRRRADGRLDHLHRRRHADRRIGAAHAGHEDLRERRHADGDASAPGRRPGDAAGRRELFRKGHVSSTPRWRSC